MQNFDGEHPQSIERACLGCVILLGSIFTLSKTWDVDAKFAKGVSASYGKNRLRMQNFCGKHPQVIEKARCRCNCTIMDPIVWTHQTDN